MISEKLALLVFLYWLVKGIDFIVGVLFRTPHLKNFESGSPPHQRPPKISIIFAAKNEALSLGEALEKMLMQNYPDFEVIAVNDRSDDETLLVLNAVKHPHLKVVDLTQLPEHWLGKTHALYRGAQVSSGEWLLFTDADVNMWPHTLSAAMGAVNSKKLDHLSLFPKIVLKSYLETVFVSYFSIVFNMRFRTWAARSRRSRAYVGIGAFNLVRREAYEKIGTHRSLALDIADDMMLGKLIKRAGFHQMAMVGDPYVSVRWVEGAKGVLQSLHKNGFRGLNYNRFILIAVTAGMILIDILPFVGLLVFHGIAFWLCAATVILIGFVYLSGIFFMPLTLLAFPAHVFASFLFIYILWRSALSAIKKGGIEWRGTVYPLKELRKTSARL